MTTQTKSAKRKSSAKSAASARHGEKSRRSIMTGIDTQLRQRMITEAAYYIAAERGFQGGSAIDDWLTAEAKIDAQLLK
jgi:hypothetical protein